jgi:hypothetical protein
MGALLLSPTFGRQGSWIPAFGFPWQERRVEAPALRVVVVPAQIAADPGTEANPRAAANPATDAATRPASAQLPVRADRPDDTASPPGLAREYDVIEIRGTWHFDMAIRLY